MSLEDLVFDHIAGILVMLFAAVLILLAVGVPWFSIHVTHATPIHIFVDGREVYHGPEACVQVQSGGATTTVTLQGGLLCWRTLAVYVSRDVKIEGDMR